MYVQCMYGKKFAMQISAGGKMHKVDISLFFSAELTLVRCLQGLALVTLMDITVCIVG